MLTYICIGKLQQAVPLALDATDHLPWPLPLHLCRHSVKFSPIKWLQKKFENYWKSVDDWLRINKKGISVANSPVSCHWPSYKHSLICDPSKLTDQQTNVHWHSINSHWPSYKCSLIRDPIIYHWPTYIHWYSIDLHWPWCGRWWLQSDPFWHMWWRSCPPFLPRARSVLSGHRHWAVQTHTLLRAPTTAGTLKQQQ